MTLKCGIVGLPNVGKSTLFNALTKANIEAQNYPFCTIEPNTGIVLVPDSRLKKLADIVQPEKVISTTFEFVDIAGLVAGAAQGEGLGNKFLAHIRETDAIAHVVRCFIDDNISHVADEIDPQNDIEIINTELLLADLETIEKSLKRIAKQVKSGQKEFIQQQQLLMKFKKHLDTGSPARTLPVSTEDLLFIKTLHLITMKPVMYLANVDEEGLNGNKFTAQIAKLAKIENAVLVIFCAAIEAELSELPEEEKIEFLTSYGINSTGLEKVIQAGYRLLKLQTFFTAGVKEVRAWTVKKGATASQAAGCIHSDFEKGFIRAEVIAFEDFIFYKGESGAKEAGKWRLEGKDYIMEDADVIHFRFNV